MTEYTLVTGSGGSTNTLDISLSDSHNQKTGNTLNFSLVEAITRVFSEALSVDGFTEESFLAELSEGFSLSEERFSNTSKLLVETASLQGRTFSGVQKVLQESALLEDVAVSDSTFFRVYTDEASLNDGFAKTAKIDRLTDTLTVSDGYSRVFDAVRSRSDSIKLNDSFVSDAEFFRARSEVVGLDDGFAKTAKIDRLNESLGFDGDLSFSLLKSLTQSLSLNGLVSTEVSYFREFEDGAGLNDVRSSQYLKSLTGSVVLTDERFADVIRIRSFSDSLGLTDNESFILFKQLSDTANLSDFRSILLKTFFDEQASLNDVRSSTPVKQLSDSVGLNDVYSREADYSRVYDDSFLVVIDNFSEMTMFTEFLKESLSISDVFNSEGSFERSLETAVQFVDEFDFKFFEGPGIAPYFANIAAVLAGETSISYSESSANNEFGKAGSGSISYGEQPQR